MNMSGVNSVLASVYQDADKVHKIAVGSINYAKRIQGVGKSYLFNKDMETEKEARINRQKEYQMSIEEQSREIEKDKTDTDVIIKSDGSRVLVVTINVGGMRSSMSMEISKPTMLQNDMSNQRIEDSRLLRSENVEMTEEEV